MISEILNYGFVITRSLLRISDSQISILADGRHWATGPQRQATGPSRQATGPSRFGAGVGIGMLMGVP